MGTTPETETETEIADDKNTITDVAFGVNDALLGQSLATPLQRAIAITIDAFLVLMLTHVSGVVSSIVAGLSVFKFGKKGEQKRWRFVRYLLRLIGGFVVFVSLIVVVSDFFYGDSQNHSKTTITSVSSIANSVKLGAVTLSLTNKLNQDDCDRACYNPLVKEVLDTLIELESSDDEVYEFIDDNSSYLPLESEQDRLSYVTELHDYYQNKVSEKASSEVQNLKKSNDIDDASKPEENAEDKIYYKTSHKKSDESELEQPTYSPLEFVKGIITDLGLGFGWAALYFTAFPAWWKGQTPGKKLMGIRVIQLDGTYMSVWESFGRYGGYGAGFATGLLGFVQIYWDSNRQAIQDKISATVVIKGDL